jgi:hypothetical protein
VRQQATLPGAPGDAIGRRISSQLATRILARARPLPGDSRPPARAAQSSARAGAGGAADASPTQQSSRALQGNVTNAMPIQGAAFTESVVGNFQVATAADRLTSTLTGAASGQRSGFGAGDVGVAIAGTYQAIGGPGTSLPGGIAPFTANVRGSAIVINNRSISQKGDLTLRSPVLGTTGVVGQTLKFDPATGRLNGAFTGPIQNAAGLTIGSGTIFYDGSRR